LKEKAQGHCASVKKKRSRRKEGKSSKGSNEKTPASRHQEREPRISIINERKKQSRDCCTGPQEEAESSASSRERQKPSEGDRSPADIVARENEE